MSMKMGRAPTRQMAPAVAKKVNGVVMTSSPPTDAQPHERREQRIGPAGHADRVTAPAQPGDRGFKLAHRRAAHELLTVEDRLDCGAGSPA